MEKSIAKSFIKNNTWLTIGQMLIYIKGIVLMPILIKTLGVDVYGGYLLLVPFISFIWGITSFGAGFRFRRFIPSTKDPNERKDLFYTQFLFTLISVVFFSILLIVFNNFIKVTILSNQVSYSVISLIFLYVSTFIFSQTTDFFLYNNRMKHFSIATTLNPYIHIAFIITIVYVFKISSIDYVLYSQSFSMLIVSIPLAVLIIRELGFYFPRLYYKRIIDDIKLGFPLVLSFIVDFVLNISNRFIIALFMTTSDVGIYSPGYTIGSFLILVPKVLSAVLPPLLSKISDEGKIEESYKLIEYAIKSFFIIAIPFVFASYFLAKPLLLILANAEVSERGWLVAPVVAIGILFYGLNAILSQVLFVQCKTKTIFSVNAVAAIANVILNVILIYFVRNIIMGAISASLSLIISFIIINSRVSKNFRIKYDYIFILKTIAASLIMCFAILLINQLVSNIFVFLLVSIIGGVIIYFTSLFAFKTLRNNELQFILHFVKRKK